MADWKPVADFDAAYDNSAAVPGSDGFVPRWSAAAAAFREVTAARGRADLHTPYGPHERQRYDLFRPDRDEAAGLVVFVHGGYWNALDRTNWSHLARGCRDAGFAVAVPSYRLAPEARIGAIAEDVARGIANAASRVAGPIRLVGHSAGGHLVARMIATDTPLHPVALSRIDLVVPISGLFDLRPIRRTRMNDVLRIDAAEALTESPVLLEPIHAARIHAVVGGEELPELRRQTTVFAAAWSGLGARIERHEIEGRHHFDVIDGLTEASSRLTRLLTGSASL